MKKQSFWYSMSCKYKKGNSAGLLVFVRSRQDVYSHVTATSLKLRFWNKKDGIFEIL